MEIVHIKKNTFEKNQNFFLLLIPLIVFVLTLAVLLTFLRGADYISRNKTVAGESTTSP